MNVIVSPSTRGFNRKHRRSETYVIIYKYSFIFCNNSGEIPGGLGGLRPSHDLGVRYGPFFHKALQRCPISVFVVARYIGVASGFPGNDFHDPADQGL